MARNPRRLDVLMMSFVAWMSERQPPLSRNTRRIYRDRVRKAQRLAMDAGYSLLADDIRVVRLVLGRLSPTPSNQRGYLAALTLFFDFLVAQGLRKDNPAAGIGRPPARRYLPRPLAREALRAYLRAASGLGPAHYAVAALGIYQGLRCAEIASLGWSQIFHAEGRQWMDVGGKGPKKARLPVHQRTARGLAAARAAHGDPFWVFPSPVLSGSHVSHQTIRGLHRAICAAAGIGSPTLHQLRHSHATFLRRDTGADQAVVQRGLRHDDPASTQIYMLVLDDELAEHIDQLDFESGA